MHNNFYKYALFAVLAGWIFTAIGFYWRKPAYAMDWSMTTAIGKMGAVSVSPWLAGPDVRKRREEAMIVSRMTAVGMVLRLKSLYSTMQVFLNCLNRFRFENETELEKLIRMDAHRKRLKESDGFRKNQPLWSVGQSANPVPVFGIEFIKSRVGARQDANRHQADRRTGKPAKADRTGMTIIEELDKTVEFPKSSVYNIEKKIPELVGTDIPDMDKAGNDFTGKPVKGINRKDPEQ